MRSASIGKGLIALPATSAPIFCLSSEYIRAVPADLAEIYKQLFSVTIFKSDVFLTNMEVSFSWLRAVDKEKTWNLEGFFVEVFQSSDVSSRTVKFI